MEVVSGRFADVVVCVAGRCGRGDAQSRRAERAENHETPAENQERHAPDAEGCSPADHRQSPRAGSWSALQPDSPAADVTHLGGPRAPFARQSYRQNSLQVGRSCPTLCSQG